MVKDNLELHGRCTLLAWKRDEIPARMRAGLSYPQAKYYAIADGCLVDMVKVRNLIVTLGKGLVGDLLIGVETVGLTYHAIGTGITAPNVADVLLTTEVARKAWSTRVRTVSTLTLDAFYLASESTFFIKECGVFGGATASITPNSGTMLSHFLLSYDNSAGSNDLTLEWQLAIG